MTPELVTPTIILLSWALAGFFLGSIPFIGAAWLIMATAFKYSSLASLTAAAIFPIFILFFSYNSLLALSIALTVLIFWKHKENIRRLLNSTESKIGQK